MYNISLKETVFLVFDVLAVDGQPCLRQNFKERMAIIRYVSMCVCVPVCVCVLFHSRCLPFLFLILFMFFSLTFLFNFLYRGDVMNRCAKYLSKPAVSSSGQPVRVTKLIRKNFVEKHQLQSDLLSKISLVEGERVYFDSDRRHHKSDGIIFQPDSPYTFSIDSDLLKWKWSEVRSVDLQVVLTPTPGTQSGSKGGINVVCCHGYFFIVNILILLLRDIVN